MLDQESTFDSRLAHFEPSMLSFSAGDHKPHSLYRHHLQTNNETPLKTFHVPSLRVDSAHGIAGPTLNDCYFSNGFSVGPNSKATSNCASDSFQENYSEQFTASQLLNQQGYAPWNPSMLTSANDVPHQACSAPSHAMASAQPEVCSEPSPTMTEDASAWSESTHSFSSPDDSHDWANHGNFALFADQGAARHSQWHPGSAAIAGDSTSIRYWQSQMQPSLANHFPLAVREETQIMEQLPQRRATFQGCLTGTEPNYAQSAHNQQEQCGLGVSSCSSALDFHDAALQQYNTPAHSSYWPLAKAPSTAMPYKDPFMMMRSNRSSRMHRGNYRAPTTDDALLVKLRKSGWSYRKIKENLGLREAESTLRGRYRTMTKAKHERVRTPEWQEVDIALLRLGVDHLRDVNDHDKIPWKKVTEFMVEHGGTYKFGAATCKKKWSMLMSGDVDED